MKVNKAVLILVMILLLSFNAYAFSFCRMKEMFLRNPMQLKEANLNPECLQDCLEQKNNCQPNCEKSNYAVCNNNCLNQNRKCRQDCKGDVLLKKNSLRNILGNFFW